MLHNLVVIIVAGNNTTVNWIASTIQILLTDPAFRSSLTHGHLTVDDALDLVLWRQPPTQNFPGRYATRDLRFGGQDIRAGDMLILGLAGANADPEVLPEDGRPVVGNRSYLAFGAGPHTCPARDPARLITRTAVDTLRHRLPDMEIEQGAGKSSGGWSLAVVRMAGTKLPRQLVEAPQHATLAVTVIGEEPHLAYNRVLPPSPRRAVRPGGHRPPRPRRRDRGPGCGGSAGCGWSASTAPRRRCCATTAVACRTTRWCRPPAPTRCCHRCPACSSRRAATTSVPSRGARRLRTMDDCGPRRGRTAPGHGRRHRRRTPRSAARALGQRGAQVVLAHQGEHLMERQLDPGASRLLRRHMAALGVEVHTECRARGLRTDGRAARAVHAVELADGYALEADLVVLACGVRPRVGLARAAGLEVARGIVVDDELRTRDPRVFAIGDCAEHDGVVYGLASAAQEQADVLARLLSPAPPLPEPRGHGPLESHRGSAPDPAPQSPEGLDFRYTGTRALTRLTLTSTSGPLDLAAFGNPTPAPGDDVIHLTDATRNTYRKVVVRGDRLLGGILLGDLGTVGALARAWEGDEPLPATPLLHLLTNDGGS
ncbi:Nitric oxide reductase FlRd-NAD(+) reductase [Streptomyces antimycoticus]